MEKSTTERRVLQQRKYSLIVILFLSFILLNNLFAAQRNENRIVLPTPPPEKIKAGNDDVLKFTEVDEEPEFPGSRDALRKWFLDHMPPVILGCGIPGKAFISFIVEKDGSLTDIQIVRPLDPWLDKAAVKVVEAMPRWKPGMHEGDTVRVRYITPVSYKTVMEAPQKSPIDSIPVKSNAEEVLEEVDSPPEFPGGEKERFKWIQSMIAYPKGMTHVNMEIGKVKVTCIVEKDGSLSNIEILRGVSPSLDREALRVVNAMPKWKPGVHEGDTVRVRQTVPVDFLLPN